jgi:cytochrome P450
MSTHQVKDTMTRLGIGEEQFRALGLAPLVEVAWADGQVDFAKRSAVTRFAKRKGWLADGTDSLVEGWLKQRPSPAFFDDARAALAALVRDRRGLGNAFPEDTLSTVLCACRDVAAASGGLFGLRDPISKEEDEALQRISAAFDLGAWREATARAEAAPPAAQPGPQGHFLLGSVPELNRDPLAFTLQLMRDHGDVAHVRLGPMDGYFLSHPDGLKHVLMDNHRNYRLPPMMEDMKEFLGEGLLTTEGDHWRRHRRMIQPAFHMDKLSTMADTMARITAEDLSRWHSDAAPAEPVNLMDKLMQLTLRVAGVCMFGMDLSDDVSAVLEAAAVCLEHMIQRSRQLFRLPIAVPTEANRRFVQARGVLDQTVLGLARARREGKTPEKADVLQLLLDARDEDTGSGLSEKELRDELLTMMGAGTETTALALMWTCSLLSQHPTVLRAVQEEVKRVLGDRPPTLADTRQMPLLKQVLDESMRLRPPFYMGARLAVGEDVIGGVTIKPGSIVLTSTYAMHRHPKIWPNPEGFDPDRMSAEASKDRHPCAFLPFSTGMKKCIGMNFATMEMSLVLPMLLQKFEMHLLPGLEPEPYASLSLRAKDGCWMTLHPRSA